jgi:hypothetical protein
MAGDGGGKNDASSSSGGSGGPRLPAREQQQQQQQPAAEAPPAAPPGTGVNAATMAALQVRKQDENERGDRSKMLSPRSLNLASFRSLSTQKKTKKTFTRPSSPPSPASSAPRPGPLPRRGSTRRRNTPSGRRSPWRSLEGREERERARTRLRCGAFLFFSSFPF